MNIETESEKRVKENLTPIDVEQLYRDMIDENSSVTICGQELQGAKVSEIYEEYDATAYRTGLNDFFDDLSRQREYEEIDDELYDTKEVEEIRDEVEAEEAKELEASEANETGGN